MLPSTKFSPPASIKRMIKEALTQRNEKFATLCEVKIEDPDNPKWRVWIKIIVYQTAKQSNIFWSKQRIARFTREINPWIDVRDVDQDCIVNICEELEDAVILLSSKAGKKPEDMSVIFEISKIVPIKATSNQGKNIFLLEF